MPYKKPAPRCDIKLRDSIEAEIKSEYGAFLSQACTLKYLGISKKKKEVISGIPCYIDPMSGRKRYRAAEVAEWLARHHCGIFNPTEMIDATR